eukprot:CAMPEP_0119130712 /NCGR_PEP_ID=MMETSP1310-20130426/8519_1 /TAXON_ID=464262 /ORGANISM="Genus nov. species nov., Strain RCC2339" /LENGTH=66 /DNA_ID=CAMNT_0007121241 /DNA_START=58 /DNA_END=258 /DNA_ORIENTATION=+
MSEKRVYVPKLRVLERPGAVTGITRFAQSTIPYAPVFARWGLTGFVGMCFMLSTTPKGIFDYCTKE